MGPSEALGLAAGGIAALAHATGAVRALTIWLVMGGPGSLFWPPTFWPPLSAPLYLAIGVLFGAAGLLLPRVTRPWSAAGIFGALNAAAALPGDLMGGGLTGFFFWIPWTMLTILTLVVGATLPALLTRWVIRRNY